jgi:hypothetical protein
MAVDSPGRKNGSGMQIEVDAEVSLFRSRPGYRSIGFQFEGY